MRVPEAVVAERDARVFELRKAGMNFRQIASALDISTSTAHAAVTRSVQKINKQLAEDHGDAWRMELERLDAIQAQLWPMTRPHEIDTNEIGPDGEPVKIRIPPNLDAIDRVLKIMDRRAKLLGLDKAAELQVSMGDGASSTPILGAPPEHKQGEVTAAEEARRLLAIALQSGVIARESIDPHLFGLDPEEIEDAEIVEDEFALLPAATTGDRDEAGELIPPPWMDDEDEGLLDPELPALPWAEDDPIPDDFV